jgi:hypothetical protein
MGIPYFVKKCFSMLDHVSVVNYCSELVTTVSLLYTVKNETAPSWFKGRGGMQSSLLITHLI